MREQLISVALRQRWQELCEQRSRTLIPQKFGNASLFVSQLRDQLLANASRGNSHAPAFAAQAQTVWLDWAQGCLDFLREVSLGCSLQVYETSIKPPVGEFIEWLEMHRREPQHLFQHLSQRYKCPLNTALPSEDDILEYLLKRLMVQDRATFESRFLSGLDSDALLLKLNLVAVAAASVRDLRYLDALNYYYERLPAGWIPKGQYGWLLASFFGLYAQALRRQFKD